MLGSETNRQIVDQPSSLYNTFCRIARIYDAMCLFISFGLIHYWRRRAARYLALGPGEIGLDLGTGTANFAITLLKSSDPSTYLIGIDFTAEMLARGRLKLRRRGLAGRVELRVGNVEHLDLPDNSVDCCASAFLVRTLDDLEQGFQEMLRVVRPGGRVVCLEVSHPPNKVWRMLFHFYFYRCAAIFGILLGQRLEAYQYLPPTLRGFPDASQLKAIMEECGWNDVHFRYLSGGMVAIHGGTKR